jgi:glycosyltransferase involved in cell wall biosynthesis
LRLYTERLSTICKLTIVTSDPTMERRSLPAGVEMYSSLIFEDLSAIYRGSQLFVFPTQQDFMPQVLAEALAFGLPCIASDVGAVRDLVRNDETGFLMSPGASIDDWASLIERLAADPAELSQLSKGARAFAEENLSPSRFYNLLEDAIQGLSDSRRFLASA